jgi:hypothetical protein
VKEGNYELQEKSMGKRKYYRFHKPGNTDFPFLIELFSRKPDEVLLNEPDHLTPIPVDEDLSSLSAILLSNDYYSYILEHSTVQYDVHIANTEALICLKAKAFIDMTERKAQGNTIDNNKILKHKNDIFRLAITLTPSDYFELPKSLFSDLNTFINSISTKLPDKAIFKDMGLANMDVLIVFNQLKKSFGLQ